MTKETEPLHHAHQLRDAITDSAMSWREAAVETDIPKATLRRACDWGGASLTIGRLLAIAQALGTAATELLPDLAEQRDSPTHTPDVILALSLDDAITVAAAAGLSLAQLVPELKKAE